MLSSFLAILMKLEFDLSNSPPLGELLTCSSFPSTLASQRPFVLYHTWFGQWHICFVACCRSVCLCRWLVTLSNSVKFRLTQHDCWVLLVIKPVTAWPFLIPPLESRTLLDPVCAPGIFYYPYHGVPYYCLAPLTNTHIRKCLCYARMEPITIGSPGAFSILSVDVQKLTAKLELLTRYRLR